MVSIHASRTGGDRGSLVVRDRSPWFQSTPPAREATANKILANYDGIVSIHASRTGGDWSLNDIDQTHIVSIHASRTGGDDFCSLTGSIIDVSIHASRTGGDIGVQLNTPLDQLVSIHASRTGGDS